MPAERDRMVAGHLYDPADPDLAARRLRAREMSHALNATRDGETIRRREILVELLGAGGDTVTLEPPFYCDYGENIYLGERVFFNFDCVVLDVCHVTIGDFTKFGPAVQIYTPLHPMNALARRGKEYGKPVAIGSDVWVGGGRVDSAWRDYWKRRGDRCRKCGHPRHTLRRVRSRKPMPDDPRNHGMTAL